MQGVCVEVEVGVGVVCCSCEHYTTTRLGWICVMHMRTQDSSLPASLAAYAFCFQTNHHTFRSMNIA
jgi:hypothetical protein